MGMPQLGRRNAAAAPPRKSPAIAMAESAKADDEIVASHQALSVVSRTFWVL